MGIARHVIRRNVTQETWIQSAFDDVASNVPQSLPAEQRARQRGHVRQLLVLRVRRQSGGMCQVAGPRTLLPSLLAHSYTCRP